MIDLETRFTRSATDRLADERPDVEALIGAATVAGTRIKRRRYAGGTALGAASAAAVVTGVVLLAPSPSTTPTPPGFAAGSAAQPADPELVVETVDNGRFGESAVATYGDRQVLFIRQSLDAPADRLDPNDIPIAVLGSTKEMPRVVHDLLGDYERLIPGKAPAHLKSTFPGITDWSQYAQVSSARYRQPDPVAFSITPSEGWACDEPADQKASCAKGDALLTVIQRPAPDHEVWSTSPDKGGPGTGVLVSEVHDGHFVSIQPTSATPAEVQEIAGALTWADGAPVF